MVRTRRRGKGRRLPAWAAVVLLLLATGAAAQPAPDTAPDPAHGEVARPLAVAVKEAPPFVIHEPDGSWSGLSIELWRHLADELHLSFHFVDQGTVPAILDAVASGRADVGIAAITVTAERRSQVDFTQPYFSTGLGVAVASTGAATWLPLVRAVLSFGFLQALLVLLAAAAGVGLLVWALERRANDHYGGRPMRGLTHGLWWSAVAMTQAGAAQGGPATVLGRVVAVIWMIASIIVLATFTASITSALTTHRLSSLVRSVDDLRYLRTLAVAGTSSVTFLDSERIRHRAVATPQQGLREVAAGRADALVYDRPLLSWLGRQGFAGVEVLATSFDPQTYAIALPPGSALRPKLDVAVLGAMHAGWWRDALFRYLGDAAVSP